MKKFALLGLFAVTNLSCMTIEPYNPERDQAVIEAIRREFPTMNTHQNVYDRLQGYITARTNLVARANGQTIGVLMAYRADSCRSVPMVVIQSMGVIAGRHAKNAGAALLQQAIANNADADAFAQIPNVKKRLAYFSQLGFIPAHTDDYYLFPEKEGYIIAIRPGTITQKL